MTAPEELALRVQFDLESAGFTQKRTGGDAGGFAVYLLEEQVHVDWFTHERLDSADLHSSGHPDDLFADTTRRYETATTAMHRALDSILTSFGYRLERRGFGSGYTIAADTTPPMPVPTVPPAPAPAAIGLTDHQTRSDSVTTESTAIDAKNPQRDADHDIVRIAEALRRSPHIRTVDDVEPGDEAVWFSDASGNGHTLSLASAEPLSDEHQGEAYAWDAVTAAIGNHPHFVHAELPTKTLGLNLDTITAITRTGSEYTLTMTLDPRPGADSVEEVPVPVDHILRAVGQLRSRGDDNPDRVVFDASADLLEHIAGTWDQQDDPTRQRAVALALSLVL